MPISDDLERVRKLLRLADPTRNPDEGEAVNAFRRAAALMRQLGLSFDDLFSGKVEERVETVFVTVVQPEDMSDRDLLSEMASAPNLSRWERDFLSSLRDQRARGRRLSPKQREVVANVLRSKGLA